MHPIWNPAHDELRNVYKTKKIQNNVIASMPIFPNYSVTNTVMTDKVEGKLLKVAGISGVEDTHLSQNKGQ